MTRTRRSTAVLFVVALLFGDAGSAFAQKGRSYSGGSRPSGSPGRSYSGGSRAAPKPSVPRPASPPPRREYSGGSGTKAAGGSPPKSDAGRFDAAAGKAQRREESKSVFQNTAPKPTYKDHTGSERPLDPKDVRVEDLRRRTSPSAWQRRDERRRDVYVPPPQPGPIITYSDPYSNWFWFWLLTQNLDQRAAWAYHHRDAMDAQRYRDLVAKDQQLEAKVKELEERKTPRDPSFAPAGVDPDLMYTDEFAKAAYNPRKRTARTWDVVLTVLLAAAVLGFVVWLVFFKRWNVE